MGFNGMVHPIVELLLTYAYVDGYPINIQTAATPMIEVAIQPKANINLEAV